MGLPITAGCDSLHLHGLRLAQHCTHTCAHAQFWASLACLNVLSFSWFVAYHHKHTFKICFSLTSPVCVFVVGADRQFLSSISSSLTFCPYGGLTGAVEWKTLHGRGIVDQSAPICCIRDSEMLNFKLSTLEGFGGCSGEGNWLHLINCGLQRGCLGATAWNEGWRWTFLKRGYCDVII